MAHASVSASLHEIVDSSTWLFFPGISKQTNKQRLKRDKVGVETGLLAMLAGELKYRIEYIFSGLSTDTTLHIKRKGCMWTFTTVKKNTNVTFNSYS